MGEKRVLHSFLEVSIVTATGDWRGEAINMICMINEGRCCSARDRITVSGIIYGNGRSCGKDYNKLLYVDLDISWPLCHACLERTCSIRSWKGKNK